MKGLGGELEERGLTFLKGGKVEGFVVGRSVDPATKEDANPFEGEGADGGVVGRALGAVALVEGPRPERSWRPIRRRSGVGMLDTTSASGPSACYRYVR